MARRAPRLFSYRKESGAARTLRALRVAFPANAFALQMRSDWRFYISATTPDGARGFVSKAPLWSFGTMPQLAA